MINLGLLLAVLLPSREELKQKHSLALLRSIIKMIHLAKIYKKL